MAGSVDLTTLREALDFLPRHLPAQGGEDRQVAEGLVEGAGLTCGGVTGQPAMPDRPLVCAIFSMLRTETHNRHADAAPTPAED